MKRTMEQSETDAEAEVTCTLTRVEAAKRYRRLDVNELVRKGDFVGNEQGGFELWQGLTGFRADAFVRPIYRCYNGRSITNKKKDENVKLSSAHD